MNPEAWIALTFGALAMGLNVLAFAVGYGVMKGAVAALAARVTALEGEMKALQELKVTVGEVKTTMGFVLEQFKDLNASIRWMRQVPDYEPEAQRGVTPPRRRGSP